MSGHLSEPGTLDAESDGFYRARCSCGWVYGPLPDVETTVDLLMEHAADVGRRAERLRVTAALGPIPAGHEDHGRRGD